MKKQGISLITLVITIIVMTIIAGAVIMTLSDSGVMDKANEAVNETNLKQVQQLATLAWGDAYLDKLKDSTVDIEQRVIDALIAENVDMSKYDIEVTSGGVRVSIKANEGTLGSLITSARDYGKTVNYSANGITDWQVYYETNDYVYLIAKNPLKENELPSDLSKVNIVNQEYVDGLVDGYTYTNPGYVELHFGADVTFTETVQRPELWMAEFNDGDYTVNNATKKTAWFLDETLWTDFVNDNGYKDGSGNSYVVGAVGASTLEMFAASWNAKRKATSDTVTYDPEITLTEEEGYGYYINGSYCISPAIEDMLYFYEEGFNFKLASPVLYSDEETGEIYGMDVCQMWRHNNYRIGYVAAGSVGTFFFGLRPVICLKSSIPAKTVGTTGYQI